MDLKSILICFFCGVFFLLGCRSKQSEREFKLDPEFKAIDSLVDCFQLKTADSVLSSVVKNLDLVKKDSVFWYSKLSALRIVQASGQYDSALKIIAQHKKELDTVRYFHVFIEMKRVESVCLTVMGKFKDAIQIQIGILPYFEKAKLGKRICSIKANIGWNYFNLVNWSMAHDYMNQAIKACFFYQQFNVLGDYYSRKASIFAGELQYTTKNRQMLFDSALFFYNASKKYIDTTSINYDLGNYYINTAGLYALALMPLESIRQNEKALKIFTVLRDRISVGLIFSNMCKAYSNIGNYHLSYEYGKKAESELMQSSEHIVKSSVYKNLALCSKKLGKYKESTEYFELYTTEHFKEINSKSIQEAAELSLKYDMARKEKEVQEMKNLELQAKSKLNNIVFAIVIVLIIMLVFFFIRAKNNRNQKQLAELKTLLEREKLIKETEEIERGRISRNLHDNIGAYVSSMLTKINLLEKTLDSKTNLMDLKENAYQVIFNLRNIVVDLNQKRMPFTSFLDLLKVEIARLCKLHEHVELDVNEYIGFHEFIEPEKQFQLKSILLEMVNNCLKHSNCTKLDFTITESLENLIIQIRDNGQYSEKVQTEKGQGIINIQKRMDQMNGILDIVKNELGGTSYQITIKKWSQ